MAAVRGVRAADLPSRWRSRIRAGVGVSRARRSSDIGQGYSTYCRDLRQSPGVMSLLSVLMALRFVAADANRMCQDYSGVFPASGRSAGCGPQTGLATIVHRAPGVVAPSFDAEIKQWRAPRYRRTGRRE